MKAFYKGKVATVWQISQGKSAQPDWIKDAFAKSYLHWLDNHLRILMAGLNLSTTENLETGVIGSLEGSFAGYGMYGLGYIGDYLDIANHRVISEKTFERNCQTID